MTTTTFGSQKQVKKAEPPRKRKQSTGSKHILIVDDERIERTPLRMCLHQEGYMVDEAASGEEGLEKASTQRFDLILTDLRMPGLNGLEMIRAIRKKDPLVGCIILTAYPDTDSAIEAVNLAVCRYIRKPFQLTEVKRTVEECLEKIHERRRMVETSRTVSKHVRQISREAIRYRSLLEETPAIVYTATLDEKRSTIYINRQIESLLGFSQTEWLTKPDLWFARLHPDDRERIMARLVDSQSTGRSFHDEYRLLSREGQEIWVHDHAVVVSNKGTHLPCLHGVMLNVAPRNKLPNELCRTIRALRTLSECNQAVMRAVKESAFLNEICQTLVEVSGYQLAWVGLADQNGEKRLIPKAWAGFNGIDEEYVRSLDITWYDTEPTNHPAGEVVRLARPVVINDIAADCDHPSWRQKATEHGYASFIALPLLIDAQPAGTLNIYSEKTGTFDSEEMRLLSKLAGDLSFGITVLRARSERKKAEEERTRLVTAIEHAAEGIMITDRKGNVQYVNPAFECITGYEIEEVLGRKPDILKRSLHEDGLGKTIMERLALGGRWQGRFTHQREDKTLREIEMSISPVRDPSSAITNGVAIIRDVTQEVKLERQLHRAQRLESIGTLAGGIAHDFNNILAAIMGHLELALDDVVSGSPLEARLTQVLTSSRRARDLVKQILVFSRQGHQQELPIRVGPIIHEALKLLRSTLPSTIEIRQAHSVTQSDIMLGDPSQIHQVLMNLCTNAAHAMRKNGGTLEVRLTEVDSNLDQVAQDAGVTPGSYLKLTVSDTGEGIDPAIRERIFDPFFTTKGKGEGTGLGLAVVQGIVKTFKGEIRVESRPGEGTAFHIFFPRLDGGVLEMSDKNPVLPRGTERILFVDDEEVLAEMGREMLEALGYTVTAKTRSIEAMETFRTHLDKFDLVITDQTMPQMTGADLARELIRIRPDIPIIICTGYSETIDRKRAKKIGIRQVLMKPVLRSVLAGAIRSVLDNSGLPD